MKLHYSLLCCLGLSILSTVSNAQTLMTIGNTPVSKEEFVRVYQKNNAANADFSAKSINEYLDLYALYKMKVNEATALRMDTIFSVKSDINNYKSQLAKNYLTDKNGLDVLVKQAYDRNKVERDVAHILITVRPNQDKTEAKALIDSIYNQINANKLTFEDAAKKFSDDKGTGVNGGELGSVTALQMIYPFENEVYNTPVGKISKPFLTPYGYHIVKVNSEIPYRGELEVKHILIAKTNTIPEAGIKQKISTIQAELKAGKSFDELANQYSDDDYSKNKGGLLAVFGPGKMTPTFEKAAYDLKNVGDVSSPIETEFGFHIIQLVKKYPLQSFDLVKADYTKKVEADSRMSVLKDAESERLKTKVGFKESSTNLQELIDLIPSTNNRTPFDINSFSNKTKMLFSLGKKVYTQLDFMNYVQSLTRGTINGHVPQAMQDLYKIYVQNTINNFEIEDLEKTNPEYKSLINEYADGMLLFEIMDEKVWSKSAKDHNELEAYYNANKSKYVWQPGFEGTIYLSKDKAVLDEVASMVKNGMDIEAVVQQIALAKKDAMYQQKGRFEYDALKQYTSGDFKEGKLTAVKEDAANNGYLVVFVNKLHPKKEDKSFIEAKGAVTYAYQENLEKEFIKNLKAKYPMKVDQSVLKKIVK